MSMNHSIRELDKISLIKFSRQTINPTYTTMRRWWFVQLVICPVGDLSSWWFVQSGFCPVGVLSSWVFVQLGFCPVGFLSSWGFVQLGFCPVGVLSSCNSIQSTNKLFNKKVVCLSEILNTSNWYIVLLRFQCKRKKQTL